jgi:hypothetical protein
MTKITNRHGVVMPFGLQPLRLKKLMLNEGPTINRMLLELEIECLEHGGKNNGEIIHTYDDFIRNGTSRTVVKTGLRRLAALGVIKIKWGRAGVGGFERSNQFELTYLPTWNKKKRKWIPASNEWLLQPGKRAIKKNNPVVLKIALRGRSTKNSTTGAQKTANGKNSRSARKIWKSTVPKIALLSRSMLTTLSPYTEGRESTVSSPQPPSAPSPSDPADDPGRPHKIPWSTPQLVEIYVTPEELADLWLAAGRNGPTDADDPPNRRAGP